MSASGRGLRWLCEHEAELDAPRDRLERIKLHGDLAFVAARMVSGDRDPDGVWRELARRAWRRLDDGDALLDAAAGELWALPAIVQPFFELGLRSAALGRVVRAELAVPPPMAELVVRAANLSIAGRDPAALGEEVIARLRGLRPHALTSRDVYLALHMVFFVWPGGSIPRPHRGLVHVFADAVSARVLAEHHVDLAAELLVVYRGLQIPAPLPLRDLVLESQAEDGMFPAFGPSIPAWVDRFTWGYHSTLAGVLALA